MGLAGGYGWVYPCLEKSRYMSGKPHKVWYNKYKARKWDNVRNGCWRIAHSHILSKGDKQR